MSPPEDLVDEEEMNVLSVIVNTPGIDPLLPFHRTVTFSNQITDQSILTTSPNSDISEIDTARSSEEQPQSTRVQSTEKSVTEPTVVTRAVSIAPTTVTPRSSTVTSDLEETPKEQRKSKPRKARTTRATDGNEDHSDKDTDVIVSLKTKLTSSKKSLVDGEGGKKKKKKKLAASESSTSIPGNGAPETTNTSDTTTSATNSLKPPSDKKKGKKRVSSSIQPPNLAEVPIPPELESSQSVKQSRRKSEPSTKSEGKGRSKIGRSVSSEKKTKKITKSTGPKTDLDA